MGVADDMNEELVPWDATAWRTTSRNRTFMLPDVISERLDSLVQQLEVAGIRVTRAEIVGALILAASTDTDEIGRLVRAYKQASVADVYLGAPEGPGLRLETTQPGPRPRRA